MSARVLVVDDNPVNLKLACEVLSFEGFEVLSAVDAVQALCVLEASVPDLILMDIALPGVDGLTLTRQLKQDPRWRAVPVVALTASAMKGDAERAFSAGCEGYIRKPIDTRAFADQVRRYLRPGGTKLMR